MADAFIGRLLDAHPNDWPAITENLTVDQQQAVFDYTTHQIQRMMGLREYLFQRRIAQPHRVAAEAANKKLVRVRRVLGLAEPENIAYHRIDPDTRKTYQELMGGG